MKKLYAIRTNGYYMLATYDETTNTVRFTITDFVSECINNLLSVEDDSSWELEEGITNFEEWLGVDCTNPEAPEILAEVEF